MNFSKCLYLFVVVVVFVFARPSQGKIKISLDLKDKIEIDELMSDLKLLDNNETIIEAGTDKESLAATDTIEFVLKEVQKSPLTEVSPLAINAAIEGVLDAVKVVYSFVRRAYKDIDMALILVEFKDTETALECINQGLNLDRKKIFTTGVPIHNAQGSALAIAGGLALSGLKNASIAIQTGGTEAFEVLEIAREMSTTGIKAGGNSADVTLQAAKNIISAGSMSAYKNLKEATKYILKGIENAASQTSINKTDIVPGIIESLKTQISTNDSAALDADAKLDKGFQSALTVLTNKTAIDATNVMFEGFRSTIMHIADVISMTKNLLEEAAKLATTDSEAAVMIVRNGIKEAQDKTLSATAVGFLALGAAGKIIDKKTTTQGIVPAFVRTELGRTAVFENLALTERIAIVGIRSGEITEGINAAIQTCDAAASALYEHFLGAADIGFQEFQKA